MTSARIAARREAQVPLWTHQWCKVTPLWLHRWSMSRWGHWAHRYGMQRGWFHPKDQCPRLNTAECKAHQRHSKGYTPDELREAIRRGEVKRSAPLPPEWGQD